MALDPKQVLMENKALVACYLAAVAALLVQFFVVMPMGAGAGGGKSRRRGRRRRGKKGGGAASYGAALGQVKAIDRTLKSLAGKVQKKELYTSKDTEAFKKRRAELEKSLVDIAKMYVDADAELERWFDELNLKTMDAKKSGGTPDQGRFQEVYKSRFDKLIRKYQSIAGAPAESVLKAKQVETDKPGLIRTQKIYWFQEAILEACLDAGVRKLLTDVTIIPVTDPEYESENYETYRCEWSCELPFRALPVLIRRILASKFTFQVEDFSVERQDFKYNLSNPATLNVNSTTPRKFFDKSIYVAKFPEGTTEYKGDQEKLIPEPSVRVTLRVSALDFKPVKVAAKPAEGE